MGNDMGIQRGNYRDIYIYSLRTHIIWRYVYVYVCIYIYTCVCAYVNIYIYIRHVYAENKETIINTINNGFAKYTRASSKLPSMFSSEWRLGINGAPHKPGCLPMCSMYDIFTMNIIEHPLPSGKLTVCEAENHHLRIFGKSTNSLWAMVSMANC